MPEQSSAGAGSAAPAPDVRISILYWPARGVFDNWKGGDLILSGQALSFVFDGGGHLFDVPLSEVKLIRRRRGATVMHLTIGDRTFPFLLMSAQTFDEVRKATDGEIGQLVRGRPISDRRSLQGVGIAASSTWETRQNWQDLCAALAGRVPLDEPRTVRTLMNYAAAALIGLFTLSAVATAISSPRHHLDVVGILVWSALVMGAYLAIWLWETKVVKNDI